MSAEYWVWLQQVLGYGNTAVSRVIAEYGTAEGFYRANDSEKIARCRLNKSQISRLHSIPRKNVYKILQDAAKSGINIITPEDSLYPERLLNISNPPAVLYVKGSRFDFNGKPAIAIVGPRKISDYGANCAYVIANTLASCGFTVVSGGAIGGDSMAHKGAIDAKGYTVGVLGSGIDSNYLKTNEKLRNEISQNGCLVSEYPPFKGVTKASFPIRNRIVSGLCNGVVVIEGGEKSGTLITARHAAEQGRDVFVIPGSPSLPQYMGSNRLIADGARPLLDVNEIINEYYFLYPKTIHKPKHTVPVYEKGAIPETKDIAPSEKQTEKAEPKEECRVTAKPDKNMLSDEALKVLEFFKTIGDTFIIDDAAGAVGMSIGTLLGAVTELEICGFIEAVPGGRYRLK